VTNAWTDSSPISLANRKSIANFGSLENQGNLVADVSGNGFVVAPTRLLAITPPRGKLTNQKKDEKVTAVDLPALGE
jgi:hypothetical protein